MHLVNDAVGNTWPHASTDAHIHKTQQCILWKPADSLSTWSRAVNQHAFAALAFKVILGLMISSSVNFWNCNCSICMAPHLLSVKVLLSLETFEELIVPSEIVVWQARFAHKSFRVCTWILSLQCCHYLHLSHHSSSWGISPKSWWKISAVHVPPLDRSIDPCIDIPLVKIPHKTRPRRSSSRNWRVSGQHVYGDTKRTIAGQVRHQDRCFLEQDGSRMLFIATKGWGREGSDRSEAKYLGWGTDEEL